MGYAATTNVVYGIELQYSGVEAFLTDLENILILHGCPDFDIFKATQYEVMDLCAKYLHLSEFVMRADGADSRVQRCEWFNPGDLRDTYTVGFDLGGKGYGCDDDIVRIIKSPVPESRLLQWTHIMAPILKCSGVRAKARMHTTEQMH